MNAHPLSVIQDTSAGMKHNKSIEGLVDSAMLFPSQREAVDGLIQDTSSRSGTAELAPVRAQGSAVGAPTLPKGSSVKAYAPATRGTPGKRMPVGQN